MSLTKISIQRLNTVVPELRAVILEAIKEAEIYGLNVQIAETSRNIETQKKYLAQGNSQTLKSYHLRDKAVDVFINGGWRFEDYKKFADIVKRVASKRGKKITWGGDWKTLIDGPHFQIES